jgi:RNA polymerase sigma factor (sigma-70 family)
MKDHATSIGWLFEEQNDSPDSGWQERYRRSSGPSEGENERALRRDLDAVSNHESPSDVGYFLSIAGRYPLLTADREKELAKNLWRARRRLFLTIEAARKSRRGTRLKIAVDESYPNRRISPATRRRLIAVEDYAERLLRLTDSSAIHKSDLDRSPVPFPGTKPKRRGRDRSTWSPPSLRRQQVVSIAPVLREGIASIGAIKEELVQHNLRLVAWAAKSYRGRGLDFIDLIQEGNMGLLRAVDRFDPAHETRFSTFATHWIRQGMGRAIAEKARMIRVPMNRLAEAREAATTQIHLAEKLHRRPTVDEIADEMDGDVQKLGELLPALASVDSLDAPLPSGEISRADVLADEICSSPFDLAEEEEMVSSVKHLLQRLPLRQRLILGLRFGIGYAQEYTLEEIGGWLGLSRERIRQIEKVARERFKNGWSAWHDDTDTFP